MIEQDQQALRRKTHRYMARIWEGWREKQAFSTSSSHSTAMEAAGLEAALLTMVAWRVYQRHVRVLPHDADATLEQLREKIAAVAETFDQNAPDQVFEEFKTSVEITKLVAPHVLVLQDWTARLEGQTKSASAP